MLKKMLLDAVKALTKNAVTYGSLLAKREHNSSKYNGEDHANFCHVEDEITRLEADIGWLIRQIVIQERLKAALWIIGLAGAAIIMYDTIIKVIGG